MYLFNRREKGISRKTRDILILAICILLLLNITQFILGRSTGSRSDVIHQALIIRVRDNIDAALSVVPQLSRMGGSSTSKWLSMTRQYLYGITQINELSSVLLGMDSALVPSEAINAAVRAIDDCEFRLSSGNSMDTPLNELWNQLIFISESIAAMETE